jgi:hypothetical protein
MTIQQKILDAIKDATSQQPIGVLALINQLGIDGETLAMELEALYNAKRINRCMHTKDGITQQVIWPVAVHSVSWGTFEISKPKAPVTPIRTSLPKAEPAPQKTAPKPKHTTQLAVLALLYRPEYAEGINLGQVRKHLGIADVLGFVNWYITNGYVIKRSGGKTDTLLLNTETAPKTYEALYSLRYPEKLGSINPAEGDLYLETVAAVENEATGEELPTLTPEQIADGWVEWQGGDTPPVSGGEYVEYILREGYTSKNFAYELSFKHGLGSSDIVAYRVAYPRREEVEESPQADTYTQQIDIERMANQMLQDNGVLNSQVGGDHYKKLGIYQPWQVLAHWLTPEELRGFAKGTVIAYLARERDKGGDDDIAKSLNTLQLWESLKNTNVQKSA